MSLPILFRSDNVIEANDQFAFDLYLRYAKDRSSTQNIVFSPFSLSCLMAMAYEGAKGETAQQIGNVFHFPEDIGQLRSGYAKALPKVHLFVRVANALWVQYGYGLRSEYVRDLQSYYDGEIAAVDFVNDPGAAISRINRWVADKTSNKIRDLISIYDVTDITRLILTNAVYFRSKWLRVFPASDEGSFTTSEGEQRRVSMMGQISHFAYRETRDAQIVRLPYRGNTVSMTVVLPKGNNLSKFESNLTQEKFRKWEEGLEERNIDLSLPKFTFRAREHMGPTLKAMGMPAAFSRTNADFSGIAPSPEENLYLGLVIHEAFIDVDETGTEAAAASAAVFVGGASCLSMSEPVVFNADHPFLFLIQENRTGTILFMGRVADPGGD